ncbi:MAG TPA: DinB family protein [Bacteroidetes bacterium]|nr:DinB family protein [Bacteroidota bacterium]
MEHNARFLKTIVAALEKNGETAQESFGALSLAQLNWKPDKDVWSVGVILDHLIVTKRSYFPVFKEIVEDKYKMSFWTRWSPFSQVLGKTMVKNLGQNSKRKYATPPAFRSSLSRVEGNIMDQFLIAQGELLELMEGLAEKELRKIRIPSPASSFLTYSCWQALRIIDVHEDRHFQQASRLMELPGFPQ